MGKKGYKEQKRGNARYIMITHALSNSDAWKACKSVARDVYCGLLIRYNGSNNGYIAYSCRDAADYANIGKNTAAQAFKKLEEVGLIKCITASNFDCRKKLAREWAVTYWSVDGQLPTNEWKTYKLKASPKKKRYGPLTSTKSLKDIV